jgi:hypothetical protein
MRFSLQLRPGITTATNLDQITTVPNASGNYALFDYASALPRAKLYTHWEVNSNDTNVLARLFSPDFNPQNNVFVAGSAPDAPADTGTNMVNPSDDAVQFVSYAPKDIVLSANAPAASILLLNDHFHPNWKVFVDSQPATLLRCNFLLRGVYLSPGSHKVEFKFQPPVRLLYVSVLALVTAMIVFGRFIHVEIKSRPKAVPAPLTPQLSPQRKFDNSAPRKKAQRK